MNSTHPTNRDAVRNLQRYLLQLSFGDDRISPPPVDGIFDTATERSLMDYQKTKGLQPTGRTDYTTWTLLYEDYLASLILNDIPRSLNTFPRFPESYSVAGGAQDPLVPLLQFMLNELRLTYDGIDAIPITGIFDEATETGVAEFQSRNGLDPTGEVDKHTWNALVDAYNQQESQ